MGRHVPKHDEARLTGNPKKEVEKGGGAEIKNKYFFAC